MNGENDGFCIRVVIGSMVMQQDEMEPLPFSKRKVVLKLLGCERERVFWGEGKVLGGTVFCFRVFCYWLLNRKLRRLDRVSFLVRLCASWQGKPRRGLQKIGAHQPYATFRPHCVLAGDC